LSSSYNKVEVMIGLTNVFIPNLLATRYANCPRVACPVQIICKREESAQQRGLPASIIFVQ
jgi:hypothetical protein